MEDLKNPILKALEENARRFDQLEEALDDRGRQLSAIWAMFDGEHDASTEPPIDIVRLVEVYLGEAQKQRERLLEKIEAYRKGLLSLSNIYEIAAEHHYHQQIEHGDIGEYRTEGIKHDLCMEFAAKVDALQAKVRDMK